MIIDWYVFCFCFVAIVVGIVFVWCVTHPPTHLYSHIHIYSQLPMDTSSSYWIDFIVVRIFIVVSIDCFVLRSIKSNIDLSLRYGSASLFVSLYILNSLKIAWACDSLYSFLEFKKIYLKIYLWFFVFNLNFIFEKINKKN